MLRLSLLGVGTLLVVVLLVAFVTTVVVVRRSFPTQDGTLSLPGLSAPVTVIRDDRGVPQIYARTADDLFRVQGYVQAQDRFFEMDFRRHVTAGRLSELVGTSDEALQADKVVRTLGWRRVAQQELDQADPTTRRYLDDYARGVNDYITTRSPSELSLNYAVLGLDHTLPRIEPWTPLDSVSWFKAMAWDLRGNYDDELARARILGTVKDVNRVDQLYPPYPYAQHAPIIGPGENQAATAIPAAAASVTRPAAAPLGTGGSGIPVAAPGQGGGGRRPAPARHPGADASGLLAALTSTAGQHSLDLAQRAVAAVPDLLGGGADGVGSNSWVVSGALTTTGKPLLANDPHLGPGIPGTWYQMGLHCEPLSDACPYDVAGFTFGGVPGVIIGHTQRIAWGMTNLGPDVTDFYLEELSGNGYLRDGKVVPLTTRQETIDVAGASPVTITVRSTDHGPLLSDVIDSVAQAGRRAPVPKQSPPRGDGYAVALKWTAEAPGHDMDAVFAVDKAPDFPSFRAAVQQLDVPAQNVVYADIDGHIGYQAPGRIPVRRADLPREPVPADGTWPMPGWDSRYDWTGYVPTAQLPWTEDPKQGFIVAANQPVTEPGDGPTLTRDFDYGYRSQRIRDLLTADVAAHRQLQVEDMQALQLDTRNGLAADLVPILLKEKVDDPFTQEAIDLLTTWDYTQPRDSAAAAYFNAVWATLLDLTFDDELPVGTRPNGGARWAEVVRQLLNDPQDPWWDDRRTPNVVESRDEILRQALVQARLRLTSQLGKDPSAWQWGELHRLRLVEKPLGGVGVTKILHPLLNRGPIDMPGGPGIVDANGYDASSGTFAVDWAPSMRMVVDLSAFDRSTWVNQTGESGHPGQANYADQLDAWADGDTFTWPFTHAAVQRAASQTLTISPAPSPS
ncbi:MAG: penicillin acylase family protein [Kineosporiaceae bacterium]